MKRIALAVAVFVVTGCSGNAVMRTGKICLTPVTSTGYSTADPIDIRPDVVLQVVSMLQAEMIMQIGREKHLSYITDCSAADFILITKLKSLDAESKSSRNFWTGRIITERKYTMGVVAHLDSGDRKPIINDIFVDEDGDKLTETITHIAENIIDKIRELPKSISTTQKSMAKK